MNLALIVQQILIDLILFFILNLISICQCWIFSSSYTNERPAAEKSNAENGKKDKGLIRL